MSWRTHWSCRQVKWECLLGQSKGLSHLVSNDTQWEKRPVRIICKAQVRQDRLVCIMSFKIWFMNYQTDQTEWTYVPPRSCAASAHWVSDTSLFRFEKFNEAWGILVQIFKKCPSRFLLAIPLNSANTWKRQKGGRGRGGRDAKMAKVLTFH